MKFAPRATARQKVWLLRLLPSSCLNGEYEAPKMAAYFETMGERERRGPAHRIGREESEKPSGKLVNPLGGGECPDYKVTA